MSTGNSNGRLPRMSEAEARIGIRFDKVGKMEVAMLPEVLIQLNIELGENQLAHADLLEYVGRVVDATGPKADWITKISAIAAYLGILMDGSYDAAAFNRVAEECLNQLRERRLNGITGQVGVGNLISDVSGESVGHTKNLYGLPGSSSGSPSPWQCVRCGLY